MDLNQIQIDGDISIEELQGQNQDFEFCLEHIADYFGPETNLRCTVGKFPEQHSPDYCWGGCPGALQEAMHIFRGFYNLPVTNAAVFITYGYPLTKRCIATAF